MKFVNYSFLISLLLSCSSAAEHAYVTQVDAFRESKNGFFKGSDSPLEAELRRDFVSLAYFPVDTRYRFSRKLDIVEQNDTLLMATSTGLTRKYVRAGAISFEIDGKQKLTVFRSVGETEHYFLPFKDATNGRSTYGGGRYLDIEIDSSENVVLDFNYAYNPYCAYNDRYDCPIPPKENHLRIPIEAGEKTFKPKQ